MKERIDLAMTLDAQNEELAKTVSLVRKQLEEESLKSDIFLTQVQKKRVEVEKLNTTLKELREFNRK